MACHITSLFNERIGCYLEFLVSDVGKFHFSISGNADKVWHNLDGMDEALGEDKTDDFDGSVTCNYIRVNKGLEDAFEVDLDDGGGHAGGHVSHLFQVLFVAVLSPWR